ncbi:Peroxidase 4 [Hordeum vulgare]|nr:Peroxidase 4 [Hordeum vulgare]
MAAGGASAQLSAGFYSSSCPGALGAVASVVQSAVANESCMGASILRLFFHDCFIQGCHGSLLLCMTSLLLKDTYMDYIDMLDGHNEPVVVNYVEDIYKYYKAALSHSRPLWDYELGNDKLKLQSQDLRTKELNRVVVILLGGDPGDLPEALGPLYGIDHRVVLIVALPIYHERGLLPAEGSGPIDVSSNDTFSAEDSEKTVDDCLASELEDDDVTGDVSVVISSRLTRISRGPMSAPRATRSACVLAPQEHGAESPWRILLPPAGSLRRLARPPPWGALSPCRSQGGEEEEMARCQREIDIGSKKTLLDAKGEALTAAEKKKVVELIGFPDVELRLRTTLHTLCRDGFDMPLATLEGGFTVLAAELAVVLEDTFIQMDKILDSECRDLFSKVAMRVFNHLHLREPGFDSNSVILPVPTEARNSAAEAVKGPVEGLLERFARVAVPPSPHATDADGGEDDTTDATTSPVEMEQPAAAVPPNFSPLLFPYNAHRASWRHQTHLHFQELVKACKNFLTA